MSKKLTAELAVAGLNKEKVTERRQTPKFGPNGTTYGTKAERKTRQLRRSL